MSKSTPLSVEYFEKFVITINKRFDKIDQRFDSVDKRFDSLENRLSKEIEDLAFATKRGFDHMDERFDGLENRVDHMEKDVIVLKTDMKDCKQYIQSTTLESASNRVRLQHLEARIS